MDQQTLNAINAFYQKTFSKMIEGIQENEGTGKTLATMLFRFHPENTEHVMSNIVLGREQAMDEFVRRTDENKENVFFLAAEVKALKIPKEFVPVDDEDLREHVSENEAYLQQALLVLVAYGGEICGQGTLIVPDDLSKMEIPTLEWGVNEHDHTAH